MLKSAETPSFQDHLLFVAVTVRLTVSVEVVVAEAMHSRCRSGREEVALVALFPPEGMAQSQEDFGQRCWTRTIRSSLLSPGLCLRRDPICSFHGDLALSGRSKLKKFAEVTLGSQRQQHLHCLAVSDAHLSVLPVHHLPCC